MIEHGRSDWPREGRLLRRADDQDLPGRLDHLPCHHPEAVQLEDSSDLSHQPVEQTKVAACDQGVPGTPREFRGHHT